MAERSKTSLRAPLASSPATPQRFTGSTPRSTRRPQLRSRSTCDDPARLPDTRGLPEHLLPLRRHQPDSARCLRQRQGVRHQPRAAGSELPEGDAPRWRHLYDPARRHRRHGRESALSRVPRRVHQPAGLRARALQLRRNLAGHRPAGWSHHRHRRRLFQLDGHQDDHLTVRADGRNRHSARCAVHVRPAICGLRCGPRAERGPTPARSTRSAAASPTAATRSLQ